MGWRSINLHTHISLVHRYVYVEVPKAGCGTMKATLGGLEAARNNPGMVERFQDAPHNRLAATPFVRPSTGDSRSSANPPPGRSPASWRRSDRA